MKKAWSKKNVWEATPPRIKQMLGSILSGIPQYLILGSDFRRWARIVARSSGWDRSQVEEYQAAQLRRALSRAAQISPSVVEIFRKAQFEPEGLHKPSDISVLPMCDKHDIIVESERLSKRLSSKTDVDYVATGGSSGQPLHFFIGKNRSSIEYAHIVDSWGRIRYTLRDTLASLRGEVVARSSSGIRHAHDPLLRKHSYSSFHMDDESIEGYLNHISQLDSFFLHTYPSSLNLLVRYIARTGIDVPIGLKGLLVGSENVYQSDRKQAEQVLNVRYFSWYGHSEKLVFAAECEESTDYHVYPTYGYCELVDGSGNLVTQVGERGEIVGTGFINEVMPFIRYRTGDFATYAGDSCKHCGRNHMLLRDITGHRTLETLVAKDGSLIPWVAVNMHDDTLRSVKQIQFCQEESGKAIMKLVPIERVEDVDLARVLEHINSRFQGQLDCRIQVVDEIPLTREGKSVYVDQRLRIDSW